MERERDKEINIPDLLVCNISDATYLAVESHELYPGFMVVFARVWHIIAKYLLDSRGLDESEDKRGKKEKKISSRK